MTLFKNFGIRFFWILVLGLFLFSAYWCYIKNKPELAAGLIGSMGAILCSQFFVMPLEIEKYKNTLSLEKKHIAYTLLFKTLNNMVDALNLLDINKKLFSTLTEEERHEHIHLKEQLSDAAEEFHKTINENILYFSKNLLAITYVIATQLEEIRLLFNKMSGSKDEEKARTEFSNYVESINKYIIKADKFARSELNIK